MTTTGFKRYLALLVIAGALAFGLSSQTVIRATPAYATSPACNPFDSFGNYYTDSYQSALWLPYVADSYWGINRAWRTDLRSWRYDGPDGNCYRGYRVSTWSDDGHCCADLQSNVRTWVCGQWAGQFTVYKPRDVFSESMTQWTSTNNQTVSLLVQVSPSEQAWMVFYNYTVGSGLGSYTCGAQADNWLTNANGEGTYSQNPYAYGPPDGPSSWYCKQTPADSCT